MGVAEYELYVHRTRSRGPGIELDGVPLLLVPAWVLEQGESQQIFMLTRMLVLCARKCHPILKLTPRELDVVFAAYARNQVPNFGAGLTSEDLLDEQGKRLYKALSRRTRKVVEETVQRWRRAGRHGCGALGREPRTRGPRLAALVCDDLKGALECLARSRDTGATDRSEETTRDLYRFWVSEAALRARRRTHDARSLGSRLSRAGSARDLASSRSKRLSPPREPQKAKRRAALRSRANRKLPNIRLATGVTTTPTLRVK